VSLIYQDEAGNVILDNNTTGPKTIQIFNIQGQLMKKIKSGINNREIILSGEKSENDFTSGVYLFSVSTNGNGLVNKIVLIR